MICSNIGCGAKIFGMNLLLCVSHLLIKKNRFGLCSVNGNLSLLVQIARIPNGNFKSLDGTNHRRYLS